LLLKKYRYEFTQEIIEDDFTLIRFQNDGSECSTHSGSKQWTNSVSFWTKKEAKFISTKVTMPRFERREIAPALQSTKELPLNLELAPALG
jgi:hypothetical protein